jgi:hypothetical protein
MNAASTTRPRARYAGLIVRDVADEILIYDLETDRAHCLNSTAALTWRLCDGSRDVAGVATALTAETGVPVSEDVVWYALERLQRDGLLDGPVVGEHPSMTRREMMRKIGLGAAVIATPAVTSIAVPTAAHAGSGVPSGQPCFSSAQCQSGVCANGNCA